MPKSLIKSLQGMWACVLVIYIIQITVTKAETNLRVKFFCEVTKSVIQDIFPILDQHPSVGTSNEAQILNKVIARHVGMYLSALYHLN